MSINELIIKLREYQQTFPDLAKREIEEDEIPYFLEDLNENNEKESHYLTLDEFIARLNNIRKNKGTSDTKVLFYDTELDKWVENVDLSYEYDWVLIQPGY